MRLDVIVPVLMCCALLWWFGQGMSWTQRGVVTAIALVLVIGVLLLERAVN